VLIADYLLLVYFSLNANIFWMGVILCLLGLAHMAVRVQASSSAPASGPESAVGGGVA
jgi:hypothetical protein